MTYYILRRETLSSIKFIHGTKAIEKKSKIVNEVYTSKSKLLQSYLAYQLANEDLTIKKVTKIEDVDPNNIIKEFLTT